jgi:hypothetical protein
LEIEVGANSMLYLWVEACDANIEWQSQTKPQVTKEIEGANAGQSPEECARSLTKGLEAGHYAITTDFLTELLRTVGRGVGPTNGFFSDWILSAVGWVRADLDFDQPLLEQIENQKTLYILLCNWSSLY